MAEYQTYRGMRVIVVYDAYDVKGTESKNTQYNIEIIYTKEKETADQCIERLVKKYKNVKTKVYVRSEERRVGKECKRQEATEKQIKNNKKHAADRRQ